MRILNATKITAAKLDGQSGNLALFVFYISGITIYRGSGGGMAEPPHKYFYKILPFDVIFFFQAVY